MEAITNSLLEYGIIGIFILVLILAIIYQGKGEMFTKENFLIWLGENTKQKESE